MSFWKRGKQSSDPSDAGKVQKAKRTVKRSPPLAMEVKILALEALDSGLSAIEVGELVGVGSGTIHKWRKDYAAGGVQGLCRKASSIAIRKQCSVLEEKIVARRRENPEHGVRRILIPDKADHLPVYLAAFSYFEEIAGSGIRFYRYKDGFLHQKVVLIDDEIGAVGTANFDNRSFRLNFEIMAVVADPGFAAEVEHMLLADFEKSVEMQPGDYEKRSFWFKLAVRLARLTAPIQ